MDAETARDRIAGRDWWHAIEVAPGVVTPGGFDLRGTADAAVLARYTRLKQLLTSSPSARLDEMSVGLSLLTGEGLRPSDGGRGE